MAKDFELDLGPLRQLLTKSPEAAGRGARQALDDIKDDWVAKAVDVAPLKKSSLRKAINGEVEGSGFDSTVIVTGNAKQKFGKNFNYGYYIHEGHMAEDGKKLRTTGTVEKFLDVPAEKREEVWKRWLEEEIADELKKAGW